VIVTPATNGEVKVLTPPASMSGHASTSMAARLMREPRCDLLQQLSDHASTCNDRVEALVALTPEGTAMPTANPMQRARGCSVCAKTTPEAEIRRTRLSLWMQLEQPQAPALLGSDFVATLA